MVGGGGQLPWILTWLLGLPWLALWFPWPSLQERRKEGKGLVETVVVEVGSDGHEHEHEGCSGRGNQPEKEPRIDSGVEDPRQRRRGFVVKIQGKVRT